MLQFTFVLFQRFQLPILVMVGVAGVILYCVSEYLAKKNRKTPGSVKHCKELTLSLNIAALILMIADMITFFLLLPGLAHFPVLRNSAAPLQGGTCYRALQRL